MNPEIKIIVVKKSQFYICDSEIANHLQSNAIRSCLLSIFSVGNSIQNSKQKDFGPWRLLIEDAYYLFKNHNAEFYGCDDALDLPENGCLKNEKMKNSYKVHKYPLEFSKKKSDQEVDHIFEGCLDRKLYVHWLRFFRTANYFRFDRKYTYSVVPFILLP